METIMNNTRRTSLRSKVTRGQVTKRVRAQWSGSNISPGITLRGWQDWGEVTRLQECCSNTCDALPCDTIQRTDRQDSYLYIYWQYIYIFRIDTVILDCEGCYVEFIEDNIERFKSQIKTILLENDHSNNTATIVFLDKLRSTWRSTSF